jgi:hypothetical protein
MSKKENNMVRQCAWCLCLIDSQGTRLSVIPLPKLYEASHGICGVCGKQWMEQVVHEQAGTYQTTPNVTDLVFEIQNEQPAQVKAVPTSIFNRRKKIRLI